MGYWSRFWWRSSPDLAGPRGPWPVSPPPGHTGPAGPRERRFSAMRAFEAFIDGTSKVCQVPMPMAGTCSHVWPSLRRSSGLFEVFDRHRLDRIGQSEAEYLRIEVQLGFERALDVLGDAEAVLLALEWKVGDRLPFLAERLDDDFRLVGRHDLVLQP